MSSTEGKPTPIIFGDASLSDIVLVVDNQDFKTNKMVLANRSDVFKAMFYGDFKESKEDRVEIKDVSVTNFRRFLEIIYIGKISDPLEFLEFPFINGKYEHLGVAIRPGESEPFILGVDHHTPSLEKLFYNFWRDTTELLNIADRFNLTSIVKDYLGSVILLDISNCNDANCHQCFNGFIFALVNGIDVSKCQKAFLKDFFTKWIGYAGEKPFPETLPMKANLILFKHLSQ